MATTNSAATCAAFHQVYNPLRRPCLAIYAESAASRVASHGIAPLAAQGAGAAVLAAPVYGVAARAVAALLEAFSPPRRVPQVELVLKVIPVMPPRDILRLLRCFSACVLPP